MKHLALMIVLALAAAGCGISKEDHQKALDEAAAKLKAAEESGAKRLSSCNREKADLEGRLAALEGEKSKLWGKLKASQQEIDALMRARESAEKRTRAFRDLLAKLRS